MIGKSVISKDILSNFVLISLRIAFQQNILHTKSKVVFQQHAQH
jgi:hypothetical protein